MDHAARDPTASAWRDSVVWLLVAWVFANYAWTLPFGFVTDDFIWMYGASGVRAHPRAWFFTPLWENKFFRPVMQFTFVLNYILVGTDSPAGYRLVNVALHALVTVLFYRLVLILRLRRGVAAVAALIFAVHPTRTEAVVWISGRTEMICAVFFFAAVISHLRGRTAWAVGMCALALSSKETAVALPFVIAVADRLFVDQPRRARRLAPYLAVLLLYLVVRALLVQRFAPDVAGLAANSPALLTLLRRHVTLFGDYVFTPLPVHGFWRSLLSLAAVGVGGWQWLAWRRSASLPGFAFAVAWTALTLLPYLGWINLTWWYVYFATAGSTLALTILAAEALSAIPSGQVRRAATAVAVVAWLTATVAVLQFHNERERRAGVRTREILNALCAALAPRPPGAMFVLEGMAWDVWGADPWLLSKPVLDAGLTEAVRLRIPDDFLDVEVGNRERAELWAQRRPTVLLELDRSSHTFRRLWQSF